MLKPRLVESAGNPAASMSIQQPFEIRGIKIPLFDLAGQYADLQGGTLDTHLFQPWLDLIRTARAEGVNTVTLIVSTGVVRSNTDSRFDPTLDYNPDVGVVRELARLIRQEGMDVTLNSFMHVENVLTGVDDSGQSDRVWPADQAAWLADFGASTLRWAALAQEIGASAFAPFGDETMHLLSQPAMVPGWASLMDQVKAVFSGQLSSNLWTPGSGRSITAIPAELIARLDLLGVGFFPNLTHDLDASVDQLAASYRSDIDGNDVIDFLAGLSQTYGKKIWIADKAFHSFDGAAAHENRIFDPTIPLVQDVEEQARLYESFLRVMTEHGGDWLAGVSFQNFNNVSDSYAGLARFVNGPLSESPQGKPAEQVMANWFTGRMQGTGITLQGMFRDEVLTGGYHHDTLLGGAGRDVLKGNAGNDLLVPGPDGAPPPAGFQVQVALRGVPAGGIMPVVAVSDAQGARFLTRTVTSELVLDTAVQPAAATVIDFETASLDFQLALTNWAFIDMSSTGNRFVRIESVTINGQPANLAACLTYLPGNGGAEPGGRDGNRGGSFSFDISGTGAVPVTLSAATGDDNDDVDGGSGIDTVRYSGARVDYDISGSGASLTVTDRTGADGLDRLASVERLQFADGRVAFDIDGHAGSVAKVLGAVFGQAAVANREYAGIGLRLMDGGMGYQDLMALAIDHRLGGAASHADVVTLLYTNVIGSAPSPAVLAGYVELLDAGLQTRASLGVLAADTSFNADSIGLAGLFGTGLHYLG